MKVDLTPNELRIIHNALGSLGIEIEEYESIRAQDFNSLVRKIEDAMRAAQ